MNGSSTATPENVGKAVELGEGETLLVAAELLIEGPSQSPVSQSGHG